MRRIDQLCMASTDLALRDRLAQDFAIEDDQVDGLLEEMRHRIEDGSYRFVVLMDRIDDRLKTLIRFVNENSRFDILGVELDYYRQGDLEIVLPRLFGAEVRKQVGSSTAARGKWDEPSFFAAARRSLAPEAVGAVRRVYDWAQSRADSIAWGTGKVRGSFNPKFHSVNPRSLFTLWSDGELMLNFGWLQDTDAGRAFTAAIQRELSLMPGFEGFAEAGLSHPGLPAERWAARVEELLRAAEGALDSAT